MNTVFMLAEILTTFIEGILLFSTVELLCGSKWTGKKRAITKILCALLYTFVILLLNRIELFSIMETKMSGNTGFFGSNAGIV